MSDFALNRTDQMLVPRMARVHRRRPVAPSETTRPPRRRRQGDEVTSQSAGRVLGPQVRSVYLWPRSYR